MSKQTKRKITVEVTAKTSEQPKSRPSVFERLGTKTITTPSQSNEYCRHWSQNGTCPYGKSCKYATTHTLTSPSKRAAKKDEQKKQNRTTIGTGTATITIGKDDPNKRLHSTIVKALRSPEPEWEQWNQTDLEDADAEMLEKRRQELQRELELQMKMESKLTKTKEKTSSSAKKGGSSSSSSNSSSSSTESSSSSEETSSTSSSTSLDSRSRKTHKRNKSKRESSSSTEPERRKKKPSSATKPTHKHTSTSNTTKATSTEKKKTLSPAVKSATKQIKSPSPPRQNHRLSQTPPLKSGKLPSSSSTTTKPNSRSPRSQSQTERKEKHRTPSPSPKLPTSTCSAPARERDRERVKEKERARDKEREKTREKERDKEKTREKEKSREREKVRERDRERENITNPKSNSSRSPKRANSRQSRDVQKKKESPVEPRNKVVEAQKIRSTTNTNANNVITNITSTITSASANSKRDSSANNKNSSPAISSKEKDDRRLERSRTDEDKKKDDRERRERERERDRDRDVKDRSLERRKEKDKRSERDDSSRDRNVREAERRERERERRLTREEREAAREKEREEALARCQERQRERERLKELAKKERERESIPSLLHINTSVCTNAGVNRIRERGDRDRERERDRGLDKPPADRVERLLPLPADRIPPMRKELERQAARSQDHTSSRSDRNRSTNRGGGRDRETERITSFEYREGRDRGDRDFSALGARAPREERRHDEKNYESPYRRDERPSYLELEHDHYEEYPEERRGGRRDAWDSRDMESEQLVVMDDERRRGYTRERDRDREEVRPLPLPLPPPPSIMKEQRSWEKPEYGMNMNRAEWERNRRAAGGVGAQHEWPDDWEAADHNLLVEEEWRHYNRNMDNWPSDENRRRWPSACGGPGTNLGIGSTSTEDHLEVVIVEEIKKDVILGKRAADVVEDVPEVKKPCVVAIENLSTSILEDALSEISDDADEILNREDEPVEQTKDIVAPEEISKHLEKEGPETKEESVAQVQTQVQAQIPTNHQESQDQDEEGIDEDGIDNMDFEEISDEELEEEVKVKGLGDALGVDWASLVAESRPRVKVDKAEGSAKKRWEYNNVLARIGVSLEMAGEQIVQDVLSTNTSTKNTSTKSISTKSTSSKSSPPIAAIQVAANEKNLVRSNLFASAGSYRRALSARRDLAIRRHLCNLPVPGSILTDGPKTPDPHFYQTVLNTIIIH